LAHQWFNVTFKLMRFAEKEGPKEKRRKKAETPPASPLEIFFFNNSVSNPVSMCLTAVIYFPNLPSLSATHWCRF